MEREMGGRGRVRLMSVSGHGNSLENGLLPAENTLIKVVMNFLLKILVAMMWAGHGEVEGLLTGTAGMCVHVQGPLLRGVSKSLLQ